MSDSEFVTIDVFPGEVFEVRRVGEPDLPRFLECRINRHTVAENASDHPERADTNGGCAMDEHRAVGRIVGDAKELIRLRIGRRGVDDRDVEVFQAGFLDRRLLFIGTMLPWCAQVEHRFDAVRLQLGEVFRARLSTGAELRRDLKKVPDRRQVLRRRRR